MLRQIGHYPFLLWFGAGCLMIAGFIELTDEFLEHPAPGRLDTYVLNAVSNWRSPLATNIFTNVTALGSATLVTLHTILAFSLLASTKDKTGAWQLVAAGLGSLTLTEVTKAFIERPRPSVVPALVEAVGYSYPSGHSVSAAAMYATLAILALRHLPRFGQRVALAIMSSAVIAGVGISRIYLGVHYPSDVLSGISVGLAWAFILAGIVGYLERGGRRARQEGRKIPERPQEG